ncbi:MbtH family NRPS accessory protein [Kibdelosporangium philippinense]|uniref:MbtH family NRPS accessory protein n=1 Tax=Kibdelosporangium philippinense TaxID=211113 RepID=A0ABS8ZFA2_9PSEU|nr:MbtH family NRPS accessory protein [Kibdelosporangium philippinense]MCE7006455.1 MbtH family NRPS accessory protein [Kibdelosporangium philippinense]
MAVEDDLSEAISAHAVEGQHSLWPDFADVPAGWTVVHSPAARQECLDYVESNWTDMRPKSLIQNQ